MSGKGGQKGLQTPTVPSGDLCDDATASGRFRNRESNHDSYRIAVLKEALGAMSAEIEPAGFRTWIDKSSWKPASVNRMKSVLSKVYRLAMENKKVKSNPSRAVKRRREENTRLRFLSRSEDAALRAEIAASSPWHLAEYLVALNTGMRPSKMYELEWSNIDFTRRQISVWRSKTGEPRHIPVNSEVVCALRTIDARSIRRRRVFLSEDNGQTAGWL